MLQNIVVNETNLPLGRETAYPQTYEPDVLFAVPRKDSRAALGLDDELPFSGVDIWNAWELTWLGPGKQPVVATAEIRVPATTANLIESKSLEADTNVQSRQGRQQGVGHAEVCEQVDRKSGSAGMPRP